MLFLEREGPAMGPVERAIKRTFTPPVFLTTLSRSAPFVLEKFTLQGLVLLLGAQQTATPITWECLEGLPDYLRGRGWVRIGSKYEMTADLGTLDAYLKGCIARATGGWVAAVLEEAEVLDLLRGRPAEVRLRRGF
jgi:hypothetical protein